MGTRVLQEVISKDLVADSITGVMRGDDASIST